MAEDYRVSESKIDEGEDCTYGREIMTSTVCPGGRQLRQAVARGSRHQG